MAETRTEQFTIVGTGPHKRLFCRLCNKHTGLPRNCDVDTLLRLRRRHRCGSRVGAWDKAR